MRYEIQITQAVCDECGNYLLIPRHAEIDPDTGDLEAECSIHGEEHGTQWASLQLV